MKRVSPLILVALLVGCQPAFINGLPNEDSPYFVVPVDSTFILRHTVTVPEWDDSVYFQNGKAMPWSGVNIYGAYCSLKLDTKRDVPQRVHTDEFVVKKVFTEQRFRLGAALPAPIQVAALGSFRLSLLESDDSDNTYEVVATVMELTSPNQPNVLHLACADWRIPQGIYAISVHKMRRALGDLFNLELARSSPR